MKMQLLLRQDKMEPVRCFKLWDTRTEDNTRFLNSTFYNPTPFQSPERLYALKTVYWLYDVNFKYKSTQFTSGALPYTAYQSQSDTF